MTLSVIIQLAFVGTAQYPLWALTVVAFCIVVLYILLVRWNDARPA